MTNMADEWMALVTKDEPLRPELKPFVYSQKMGDHTIQTLHHKWIIEPLLNPAKCALINKRYDMKKEQITEALREGNFGSFLLHHERPYRLEAFIEIADMINDPKEYGELFRYVWCDTENFFQNVKTWKSLWNKMDRTNVMTPEELDAFAQLPNPLVIYRGIRYASGKKGLSWTPDKGKAEWFAKRGWKGKNKILLTAMVEKCNVRAYMEDRETEVVVFPKHIQGMTETKL